MSATTKVFLLGDSGAGKTTLVGCIRNGTFSHEYIPTMGAEIHPCEIEEQMFLLFDFTGKEEYAATRTIQEMPPCDVALLVYDGSAQQQKNLSQWATLVPGKPTQIVMTKSDRNAEEPPDVSHLRTSALTGDNIDALKDFLLSYARAD